MPSDLPHIDDLLRTMLERGGSDLHITVGTPPGIREQGDLVPVQGMRPLTPRDTQAMVLSMLSEEQRKRFETELELDFAYSIPGVSRFRANVFQQRNSLGAVFRVIPIEIPTIEQLGLPKVCTQLADRPRGLVLVTGPTGSGKSTTLAAMIDHINETRPVHIMTLEDPIEFMHRNKKAFINQREVGEDTRSFASALKRVLRQDPDVILVGEMRDRRRSRPRSLRRKPATWCLQPCTPPADPRRSIASSTSSRRTSSSRCACSSPARSRAFCRRSCSGRSTARAE
jgi:twitching motility protein PilT